MSQVLTNTAQRQQLEAEVQRIVKAEQEAIQRYTAAEGRLLQLEADRENERMEVRNPYWAKF